MSRKCNIINNIIVTVATLVALVIAFILTQDYYAITLMNAIIWVLIGTIISGFINAVFHEIGHLLSGLKNGFAFSQITIWIFRWKKDGDKIKFSLTLPLNEAGYTEMVPKHTENIEKRYQRMTFAGFYGSIFLSVLSIGVLFIKTLPLQIFCILVMNLPISIYYLLNNLLPMSSYSVRNDGGVLYGFRNKDNVSKVTAGILKYQALLYQGKTPKEAGDEHLFNLPQLAENELVFVMLLDAQYYYYLDKNDFENAIKVSERLNSVLDYCPKELAMMINANLLYNACTFDYNEELADDLTFELEKYLNNVNTASNVRIKLAYIYFVQKEKEALEVFYKKGIREADKMILKGLGAFEKRLLNDMKEKF